jgi:concanavalin A-like lectin/glucanase superfamily protein
MSDITSNLIHSFHFENNLTDEGTGAQNGTLINSGGFTTGHAGSALNLSGTNAKASFPNSSLVDSLGGFTWAGWVKLVTPSNYSMIWSHRNNSDSFRIEVGCGGPGIGSSTSGDLAIAICNGTNVLAYTTTHFLADGLEHHVVISFNAGTISLYVDGVYTTLGTTGSFPSTTPALSSFGYYVGARSDNSLPFTGNIDELRIYQRALSVADAFALYTQYSNSKTWTTDATIAIDGRSQFAGVIVSGGAKVLFTIPNTQSDSFEDGLIHITIGDGDTTSTNVAATADGLGLYVSPDGDTFEDDFNWVIGGDTQDGPPSVTLYWTGDPLTAGGGAARQLLLAPKTISEDC